MVDLHIHSSYSDDGEFSVEGILEKCRMLGMKLVSITDHNSVRGVSAALRHTADIRVLSGVELDCTYQEKNFHLLGYHFDHTRKEFAEVEEDILRQERNAAEEKIRLFHKASGIPVNIEEILSAAKNGVVTGELIAEHVLGQENAASRDALRPYLPGGLKSDMPNVRFYWDFFSPGKAAYVPIHYLSLPDAIELIHQAGGTAVLAHPSQNLSGDDRVLAKIIAEGIDGMEVFSSYHSAKAANHYLEIAIKNHLLITCGSDFHGKHKPNLQIGGHGATWKASDLLSYMEEKL